jgi:hypothetical protein
MPFLKRPFTLTTFSIVSDTPEARAKAKQDVSKFLRAAEGCLGPQEIDQVVEDHRRARAGRKPDEALNALVLDEWDASPTQDPAEFSEAFCEKYPQRAHSAGAVKKRLERLLKAEELKVGLLKVRRKDRGLRAALQRPSLVGEARGTE